MKQRGGGGENMKFASKKSNHAWFQMYTHSNKTTHSSTQYFNTLLYYIYVCVDHDSWHKKTFQLVYQLTDLSKYVHKCYSGLVMNSFMPRTLVFITKCTCMYAHDTSFQAEALPQITCTCILVSPPPLPTPFLATGPFTC